LTDTEISVYSIRLPMVIKRNPLKHEDKEIQNRRSGSPCRSACRADHKPRSKRMVRSLLLCYTAVAAIAALATITALSSCGGRIIGYGLVLWGGPEVSLETGQIVRIQQESQIQNAYLIRKTGKELIEVPTWRIRLFPDMQQATKGAEEYAAFENVYAYSQRDGLPIREQADPEARRVYKLAEGQLVKVLSRGEAKVNISNLEDYWYEVLTEDGYRGYCFGYYLPVFTTEGDPKVEVADLMARDPMLEILLETTWRPEFFQEMVDKARIDLTVFGSQFGLFFEAEEKQVRLVTGKRSRIFKYEQVENVGANRYVFVSPEAGATDWRVNMQSKQRIVLTYSRADQVLSTVFIDFTDDIEEIVVAEQERRQTLYESFASRGRRLESSAYGRISLQEEMRFEWRDYGRLGRQIFAAEVQGSGSVDFPYYLSSELAGSFDGVISFRFKEYRKDQSTSFLYAFDNSGVRFEYLSPENIENLEAVRRAISPLVIYFNFGGF